jgi:(4-(4-[2-(gamma-L-glutamylamino)ethyl]phenoxymethyl)furan-2-yl)methanamine synthase
MAAIAGYDVGGAHLKVARIEGDRVIAAREYACRLWQGIDRLDAALAAASDLTAGVAHHAVTMTGELCELFPSRHAGVIAITEHIEAKLGAGARFFIGLKGFGDASAARDNTASVGSANFLATVQVIARLKPHALLIDMGSTTTDIAVCDTPQGLTDAERLQTGELVYTGLTRTPVPSVTARGLLAGQWQGLARDSFATMADVRRVLGTLPDDLDAADPASVDTSLRRLSRGFGRDGELRHLSVWQSAARHIREVQLQSIIEGVQQATWRPGIDVSGGVVAAGIGADEVAEIAQRLALPCVTFGELISASGDLARDATRYAAAVSVGMLGTQSQETQT